MPWKQGTVHILHPAHRVDHLDFREKRSRNTSKYPLYSTASNEPTAVGVAAVPFRKIASWHRAVVPIRRRRYGMIAPYMINPCMLQRTM